MNLYHINYKVIEIQSDLYFVPKYSMHRPAAQTILHGQLYEARTHKIVEYILGETKKSIIHAGAFFGDMLPKFSKYCNQKVYVFEPVLNNYVMAKKCQEANNLTNVILFNAAMSNETGHAHIKTKAEDGSHLGGMSHISDQSDKTELINTIKVDDLKLEELAIIHLDVEGHEIAVIEGALEKIKKEEPVILLEDSKSKDVSILEKLGYTMIMQSHLIDVWTTKKYLEIAKKAVDISVL